MSVKEADAILPTVSGFSHGAAGFCPSEHFLDPLADFLGEAVAGMSCRTPVNSRTAFGVVLGHVRGDVHLTQCLDERGDVIVLVRAQRDPRRPSIQRSMASAASRSAVPVA